MSSDLLRRLVDEARAETAARQEAIPLHHLERLARALPEPRDFGAALRGDRLAVIAEMKARTPIAGELAADYEPGRLARLYTRAGAAAISVLCQETSFGGRPEHLAEARASSDLPILRKDFVSEVYQIAEARAYGADAVLLIVGALEAERLRELVAYVGRWGMAALVEVHEEAEVETALAAGARIVGANHRNLRTFDVDVGLTERLRPRVPRDVTYVAESGIRGPEDALRMRRAGADAILVGEALMRSGDPALTLAGLAV